MGEVKFVLTFLITLLSIMYVFAQGTQSEVNVSGRVIDKDSKDPIPYVHVYTKSLSHGEVTSEQGHFTISMAADDTLVFSSIGFDKHFFFLNKDDIRAHYEVVIEMDSKTYELQPVKVTAYKDIEEFKRDILALNIPTEEKDLKLDLPKAYKSAPSSTGEPAVVIRGPISALYNQFSKEAKEKRKLEAYRQTASREKLIASKYNIDVVKRLTDLNDEGAKRLMEWCRFDDEFILTSTEYEFTVAMLECLKEYSAADTLR